MDIGEIKESIGNLWGEVFLFEEIDSTNTKGMDLAREGAPEGTIILAETQRKGKGRLGRTWISPPAVNIYLSIIMRPDIPPSQAPFMTLMASVAAASAIRKAMGIPAFIKWPNDIILGEKKVGGILTEMRSGIDRIDFIVLGIGININLDTSILPPDVRLIATSIKEYLGKDVPRIEVLVAILKELDIWYNIFLKKGPRPILDEWRFLTATIGKRVKIAFLSGVIEGVAEGIDEEGRLLVRIGTGAIEKVSSGDVTIIS